MTKTQRAGLMLIINGGVVVLLATAGDEPILAMIGVVFVIIGSIALVLNGDR